MTADEMLKQALESLGYPVFKLNYIGDAETYFVFQNVTSLSEGFADDDNDFEFHIFRVNLYSKADYLKLLKETKAALKQSGFTIANVDGEIYESDTGFYHVPITINILENLKEV